MTAEPLYPNALWRPLSDHNDEPVIVPRLFIVHTMVGYLKGTDSMFRKDGYNGVESTFGIGGPWDGQGMDGAVYQWQRIDREADANSIANPYATSIEMSDGGDPELKMSPKQVQSLIDLAVWWLKQTHVEWEVAESPTARGFGYHRMFEEWNPNRHSCPGNVRIQQLMNDFFPAVGARKNPSTKVVTAIPIGPKFPLNKGFYFGPRRRYGDEKKTTTNFSISGLFSHTSSLRMWQQQMKNRGWKITADGYYGDQTKRVVEAFQREKGLKVDGLIGPATWAAAWNAKVT